ncbi:MAG: Copper amine oxidase N-terminal domain [Candidatus Eremiobacteraeota bacterium]|nr:Copper amine oxidase N-terminal domain [Candidatus Eremiobacteraeota bacterium]
MIHALTFAAYAITLDGKTVLPHARAAVADGHVLLPVRSLGNALGANVGYDGRSHTITVQRGAHVATIPAQGTVRVVNGTAYAPLRSVATAFGLGVGYDARTRTVALQDTGAAVPVARMTGPSALPQPALTPAPPGAFAISETPRNGTQVHEPYPTISTRFAGATAIDPRSLRVLVDGFDVTPYASIVGDQVLLTPRTALAPGRHDVVVTARDTSNGAALGNAWSFDDSFAFSNVPVVAPTPFAVSAIWIDRWITPGTNAFDVYVEGAPGITGYVGVDGVGGFFPLSVNSANSYVAHVFVPNGVNQPFARIAARITLPNGQLQTIVLPQRFNITTPPIVLTTPAPPRPTQIPSPRPTPTRRSVDVPTPTPPPAHRGVLTSTPTPAPTIPPAPPRTPAPGPTPSPVPAPSASPTRIPTRIVPPIPLPTRTPIRIPAPIASPARTPAPAPAPVRTIAPASVSTAAPTPPPTATPLPEKTRRPLIRRTPAPTPTPTPSAPG